MLNSRRTRFIVMFSSLVLIALSLVIFLSAMLIRDFGQPGQETFFNGQSSKLLVMAFAMLAGLAIVLLVVVFRIMNSASAPPHSRDKRAKAGARHEPSERSGGRTTGLLETQPDTSVQLVSDTAGELRTSVGAIQEELEELMDDEAAVDKEQVQALYEETDRLRKIIDGMEQLSHAQALARSLTRESFQIEPLLNGVIERKRSSEQYKDVIFNLECEPGLAMTADPDCLTRIMDSLVDNAAKAVKNAGTVTVTAARTGNEVFFSIRDTGTGIQRRHLPHIYERFFRGTGSGIGMGLAIVSELVHACGGKIEVESAWGKGSVFTVRMPAA